MITPNICYYAALEYCKDSKETPKYVISAQAGDYPPMEELKSRDGRVYMYLMEKIRNGAHIPSIRLQVTKNGLNFTGMKEYFIDGKISGFAYGYPDKSDTYKNHGKEKPNPFYDYKNDGFLFIVHQDKTATTEAERLRPSYIELIVLNGAKVLIPSYCKMLQSGGFDEELKQLRLQAGATFIINQESRTS